jgi:glutaredoxin
MLKKLGFTVTEIDIDADAELQKRYGEMVPVIVIDGQERFWGRIDERLLRRFVRGRSNE